MFFVLGPCLCLLCGCYLRGGEKKNGIGACHRHVGMTSRGHRLDSEDVCPVARGGVGMFLLVERTSVCFDDCCDLDFVDLIDLIDLMDLMFDVFILFIVS